MNKSNIKSCFRRRSQLLKEKVQNYFLKSQQSFKYFIESCINQVYNCKRVSVHSTTCSSKIKSLSRVLPKVKKFSILLQFFGQGQINLLFIVSEICIFLQKAANSAPTNVMASVLLIKHCNFFYEPKAFLVVKICNTLKVALECRAFRTLSLEIFGANLQKLAVT